MGEVLGPYRSWGKGLWGLRVFRGEGVLVVVVGGGSFGAEDPIFRRGEKIEG